MDILAGKLKADVFRSRDPLVLQWLANPLGYKSLLTDCGDSLQGSPLAMSTVLPPNERVDFNAAKDKWVNY